MEMQQGVWKQHLRPRAVVGYGVKIFLPSPPNYVTRSPGSLRPFVPITWSQIDLTKEKQKICNNREIKLIITATIIAYLNREILKMMQTFTLNRRYRYLGCFPCLNY